MSDLTIFDPRFRGQMAVAQILRDASWGRPLDRPTLAELIEERSFAAGGRYSGEIVRAAAEVASICMQHLAGVGLDTVPGWPSHDRRSRALWTAIGIAETARYNIPAAQSRLKAVLDARPLARAYPVVRGLNAGVAA